VETTPADPAATAGRGAVVTDPAGRRARAAHGGSTPVGAAGAWDLFRMAFAAVAPPGADPPTAARPGCVRP
jgi:hypothetical protein